MAKKKRYTNVSELIRAVTPEKELVTAFEERVAHRKLVSQERG
jgi:hypothetical protein